MTPEPAPHPSAEDLLQAFAVNTLALDAVVVELAQAERALVARVQARTDGLSLRDVDTTDLALRLAGERVTGLVQMHARLGRSLRLTLALKRRIETGWPRRGEADDRRAMARRQVERTVGARIRAEFDEPAERLRALEEFLWDPGLDAKLDSMPVEELIAEIARALTAADTEVADMAALPPDGAMSPDTPCPELVAPPPYPGPNPPVAAMPVRRDWPAGMVNPPPGDYEPWQPDHDEARQREARQREARRPDD